MQNILDTSKKHMNDMQSINRDLTEKALLMRCHSYYSRIKEQLLVKTIYEIDSSKKTLLKVTQSVERQRDIINRQKEELVETNRRLEQLYKEVELRVKERTAELELTNRELSREVCERHRVEKEKEKVLEQLFQAQKMESVGRLAGGVAHDFNNLLTAIMGFSRLALRKLSPEDPLTKDLNIILEAGEKGSSLIQRLLVFSRKQNLEMTVVNLNHVVENMTKILGRLLGADLDIEFHPGKDLMNTMADVGQIEQIVLNLVVNARDAMPSGGRLIIETANVELDGQYTRLHEGLKPGLYSMLAVTDTGHGMTPDVQSRIFEPFFTTKEQGKGTGIGLATVHGIVKQHNGHIFVYSEVGKGTTFKIYFPGTEKESVGEEKKEHVILPRGTETVLVVEDESTIRRLLLSTLQLQGYKALEASNGQEAIELCATEPYFIDLLLTDIIMPGMNGKQLGDWFTEKYPGAKVVYMSGYTGNIIDQYGVFGIDIEVIQKPFSPSQVANKLRKVLDAHNIPS